MDWSFYFRGIQAKTFYIFIFVFIIIILPVNLFIYKKVAGSLDLTDSQELKGETESMLNRVKLDPLSIPLPSPGYALKVQWYRMEQFEDVFSSPDFPPLEPFQYFLDDCQVDTFKIATISKENINGRSLLFSVARSDVRLRSQLDELRFYLFSANIFSILIAGTLVWIATGITLRPIKKIIHVASRINASRSIEKVPIPSSNDENKLLAEAINGMLARIELTIQNQTNFFASAAHELKTPLAVMQAELSIALQKATDPEVLKILHSNLSETQRLDRVIQDFLLISQLRSDSLNLRKSRIELDEVVYAGVKKVKYLIQERKSIMNIQMGEKPFWILADQDKIETVIANLFENSVRYAPVASVIRTSMSRKHDQIIFMVENLVHKPLKNVNELTSEFRKSEELSSGLGMGLWICKKILDLHDSTLQLEQYDLTFRTTVIIPAAADLV